MQVLDEPGVHLYIDDFGTGQSSLRYLKRLPARLLKIDKEFIDDIDTNPEERAFLSNIIRIIKSRKKTGRCRRREQCRTGAAPHRYGMRPPAGLLLQQAPLHR
jgi:EAL domain-containing protein (putative c-di-GMP-specific phosphodiesterase class I)